MVSQKIFATVTAVGAIALCFGLSTLVAKKFVPAPVEGSIEFASVDASLAPAIDPDLGKTINSISAYLDQPERFNPQTCGPAIEDLTDAFVKLKPEYFERNTTQYDYKELVKSLFRLRLKLQDKLAGFDRDGASVRAEGLSCVRASRRALRFIRYVEDYLIQWGLKPKAYQDGKDPVAGPVLRESVPQLLLRDPNQSIVKLRSGDTLLSRGFAYTSAAIARISAEEAQFSHLTQVYIDAPVGTEISVEEAMKDPRVYTIEAHIEVGSFTRPFKDYVNDGNSRVLQYRPKATPEEAHRAAKHVFDLVRDYQNKKMKEARRTKIHVNDNPLYDFKMDNKDPKEIFCAEIVTIAYKSIGWQMPKFESTLKKNDLTKRMQITAETTFAPSDIEVDPRFTLLAEWRDVRKLASIMRKDVVLSSLYSWMNNKAYYFETDGADRTKALLGWTMRSLDLGFEERLPKNMSMRVISMTFALDRVGAILDERLQAYDKTHQRDHRGLLPSFPEQMIELERFRAFDAAKYKKNRERRGRGLPGNQKVAFHNNFHPNINVSSLREAH